MMVALNGYIKIHRKLIQWGWYSDCVVKDVFLHLLIVAAYKDGEFLGHKIRAGQAIVSSQKVAIDLGFSRQQVRTALKKLESTGEISQKSTNKFTIVTVENWEEYQLGENFVTNEQPTDNQQVTNEQPTDNQQVTTSKEGKEIKKVKKVKKVKNKPPYPLDEFSFSENLSGKILEWLTYKQEKKEPYKPTGFKSLLKTVKAQSEKHGERAIMELIDLSMAANWKGIVWDRLDKPESKVVSKPVDFLDIDF